MKILSILIPILLIASLGRLGGAQERCGLDPKPLIFMSEGVEGGIAPRAVPFQMIVLPAGSASRICVLRRTAGQTGYTQGRGPAFATLQRELTTEGLYQLPREKEAGLSDPYGMAVALHSHDSGRCWANEPPNGCLRGAPTITPDAAQKSCFERVVKRLEKLAATATEPLAEKDYQEALSSLFPTRQ